MVRIKLRLNSDTRVEEVPDFGIMRAVVVRSHQ